MRSFFIAAAALAAIVAQPALAAPAQSPRIGDIVMGKGGQKTVTMIISTSCVFCRRLDSQLFPDHAQAMVKRGYSIEIIPIVATPADKAATAVLRCGGRQGYLNRLKRIYAGFSMFSRLDQAKAQNWFIARETDFGFKQGSMRACFAPEKFARDEAMSKRAQARYKFEGTPSIYLDDRFVGNLFEDLP
jgi:hypothetical protein